MLLDQLRCERTDRCHTRGAHPDRPGKWVDHAEPARGLVRGAARDIPQVGGNHIRDSCYPVKQVCRGSRGNCEMHMDEFRLPGSDDAQPFYESAENIHFHGDKASPRLFAPHCVQADHPHPGCFLLTGQPAKIRGQYHQPMSAPGELFGDILAGLAPAAANRRVFMVKNENAHGLLLALRFDDGTDAKGGLSLGFEICADKQFSDQPERKREKAHDEHDDADREER